ncbi:uncharacterized protein B0H18DRAFT_1123785 [Fomitopsis serialis]|uniref:uncharacterized protein n=1 Tax=Fomitopsis serialis TaxID=139415 RepID=UPI0020076ABF|nr:uncharacterized protein B0H18DRAFT_1123785 [Neoantrodia serialis]KAH9917192.1 hypothetical protein B0H18DRAFT_1123785 [Neoantrodia serialis]
MSAFGREGTAMLETYDGSTCGGAVPPKDWQLIYANRHRFSVDKQTETQGRDTPRTPEALSFSTLPNSHRESIFGYPHVHYSGFVSQRRHFDDILERTEPVTLPVNTSTAPMLAEAAEGFSRSHAAEWEKAANSQPLVLHETFLYPSHSASARSVREGSLGPVLDREASVANLPSSSDRRRASPLRQPTPSAGLLEHRTVHIRPTSFERLIEQQGLSQALSHSTRPQEMRSPGNGESASSTPSSSNLSTPSSGTISLASSSDVSSISSTDRPVENASRAISSVADWEPYRFRKEFRTGSGWGQTVWYKLSGHDAISEPPVSLDADPADLFLYEHKGQKRVYMWICEARGSWRRIRVGDPHPVLEHRRFHIQQSGEPSWVTKETLSGYNSRKKRERR